METMIIPGAMAILSMGCRVIISRKLKRRGIVIWLVYMQFEMVFSVYSRKKL